MSLNNQDLKNELLSQIDQLHTTDLGVLRIKKNLSLDTDDVILWCLEKIQDSSSIVTRKGKNYYVSVDQYIITINAYSMTIITAHQ